MSAAVAGCPVCAMFGRGLEAAVAADDAYLAGVVVGWAGAGVAARAGRLDEIDRGLCPPHATRCAAVASFITTRAVEHDEEIVRGAS